MTIPGLRHFSDIESLTTEQIWGLLRLARQLKAEREQQGHNRAILTGKSLAMIFQKPSLRTRVSFEMAMQHLGGHALYLSPQEVGMGTRESAADVARVLSGYVDGIMARVFEHQQILDLEASSSVPVINGLSDFSHPCQALADLLTIWEQIGEMQNKVLAYVGDGANNMATSLLMAAGKVGMKMVVVAPAAYHPDLALLDQHEVKVLVSTDLEALVGADILYTDVWTSMGQEAEREERLAIFPPYQINAELVARTGNPAVKVMHCLPAHRGEEITDEVADGPYSLIFPQAHSRLHAQKAILAHLLGHLPLE